MCLPFLTIIITNYRPFQWVISLHFYPGALKKKTFFSEKKNVPNKCVEDEKLEKPVWRIFSLAICKL